MQLTADEINRRFPGFAVSSDEYGALEPSSGLVQADLAIKTLQVSNTLSWYSHLTLTVS